MDLYIHSQVAHERSALEKAVEKYETRIACSDGRPEWTRTIDLFRVKEAL
jgi:hypothetical protein